MEFSSSPTEHNLKGFGLVVFSTILNGRFLERAEGGGDALVLDFFSIFNL